MRKLCIDRTHSLWFHCFAICYQCWMVDFEMTTVVPAIGTYSSKCLVLWVLNLSPALGYNPRSCVKFEMWCQVWDVIYTLILVRNNKGKIIWFGIIMDSILWKYWSSRLVCFGISKFLRKVFINSLYITPLILMTLDFGNVSYGLKLRLILLIRSTSFDIT